MEIDKSMKSLTLSSNEDVKFKYVNVFKNPNKLPIDQIYLEKNEMALHSDFPKNIDVTEISDSDIKKFSDKTVDIIPALDKRWLPKCVLYPYEPYVFTLTREENEIFITNNQLFIRSLDYLLKCNYHQFWCTILFEPTASICLRSFILNPITGYQLPNLDGEYLKMYKEIFYKFILVYERLLLFKITDIEYMAHAYGMKIIIDVKLLNLPIVITLALLYKDTNREFVNKLTDYYFNNTSQLDFQIKEVEELLKQSIMIMEMIGGNLCGFVEGAVIVPLAIGEKPPIFNLNWVYSVVNYLLFTISTLNVLFQFNKPAIEMALQLDLPANLPYTYVNVYRELYELLQDRDELLVHEELCKIIFEEINLGRSEFIDVFHIFVSHCLDKVLISIGDTKQQENLVEIYLKLLSAALDEDYFICDYDIKYKVASLNEVFESCTTLDSTRTQFISSCISKLPRHKKLEQFSKFKRKNIEHMFKAHKPFQEEIEESVEETPGPSNAPQSIDDENIDEHIKGIVDMFPHLGDGFVLKCLEAYDYNSSDVINAILEENLPPHLCGIPFDTIRIPPEPEPEKPIIAFKGKKPDYDDALKLLNDKRDMKEIKTFVLEGVQYGTDNIYDDEYDDRDYELDPVKVADGPPMDEIITYNPNRNNRASDTSSSDEDIDEPEKITNGRTQNNKANFCEDPALIRARREQRYQSRNPQAQQPNKDVVGRAKGQGQDKNVLLNRQKKATNKSSKANHSRKSGAQFKRNKGMIPS